MSRFLINTLISSVAVMICAYLLPGVEVSGFLNAFFVAISLALLNQFVKPLLILLTIPATILTLGLFLFVINALIIMLADWIIDGFQVNSFIWALLFSLALSAITSILDALMGNDRKGKKRKSEEC